MTAAERAERAELRERLAAAEKQLDALGKGLEASYRIARLPVPPGLVQEPPRPRHGLRAVQGGAR